MQFYDHNIATAYYDHKHKVIKITRSKNPNNASVNCFARLIMNTYGATYAEVYEMNTGIVHAQFKASKAGKVEYTYKYNPRDFNAPLRIKLDVLMKDVL